MIAASLLLLAAAAERPAVVSVHAGLAGGRAALEVVTTAVPGRVGVERAGPEVVVTLDAGLRTDLGWIGVVPPLQAIDVRKGGAGTVVRVKVDPQVPYEVRREGTLLTVLFGDPGPAASGPRAADVQDLYRGLLPAPGAEPSVDTDEEADRVHTDPEIDRAEVEGLQIGLLTLRPAVSGLYVDAEYALLETARPLADKYYEIRPQLAGELPLSTGRLQGDYELRLRRGSSFDLVDDTTTHIANASLTLPLGPNVMSRAGGHFTRGLLETTEVDPGREYFFQLGRYKRYDLSAGLRVETGGRLDFDVSGLRRELEVDDTAGFFSHRLWIGTAGLGVELGPRLRGSLSYVYEEIPPLGERPVAEMQAHTGQFGLEGEILPLVTGFLNIGYRDQRNPAAGAGGTRYTGLSGSLRLLKDFSPSSNLLVTASRLTPPSAFESNGFFISTSVQAELRVGLPLSLSVHGGGGYHLNRYRVVSPEIGGPREDRITSWSVGLGRSLSGWAFARADYRYEQRESNIDLFDTDAHSLTIEVGVRLYRPLERR
jgi:hypothetical protein